LTAEPRKPRRRRAPQRPVVLVTGFPAFTARRMLRRILEGGPEHALVLVQDRFLADLQAFAKALPGGAAERVEPLVGDVTAMDLGLSGAEVKRLFAEVSEVYHLAAIYHVGVPRAQAFQVNVGGTRNVLDLATSMKRLQRVHHFSTTAVSGRRKGLILESDLSDAHGFHDHCEETRYRAECLARRAMRDLPVTVYRPSLIVGDSETGEVDRFTGPYYLMVAIVGSPIELPLPLPGRGEAPLNLVPIDYVVEAAWRIGRDPRSAGRTFHLVDPKPLPARQVFELVARHAGKPPPRGVIPGGRFFWEVVAGALSRVPALERLLSAPRQAFEQFHHEARYDASGTEELLAGTGIVCPRFETYVERLVRFIEEFHRRRRRPPRPEEEPLYDPLY
jgi:thioester reductase-like protein